MSRNSSNTDQTFLPTIHKWLAEKGEVLLFIEWVASEPDPYLFKNKEQLHQKLAEWNQYHLANRPYFSVYGAFAVKNYNFPLRGVMDQAFWDSISEMISKEPGQEFLLLELGEDGFYHFGQSIAEPHHPLEDIKEYWGKECVFGKYPTISTSPIPEVQIEAAFPISLGE